MGKWVQNRLNSFLDSLVFAGFFAVCTSGGIAWNSDAPTWVIIGVAFVVFIGVFLLFRLGAYLHLFFIIKRLVSVGIVTDSRDNILRILHHDREALKIGLAEYKVQNSEQAKQVYGDFNAHGIVSLEQRKDGDYRVLTELGKKVVLYLEKHPRVLHKEGSCHR